MSGPRQAAVPAPPQVFKALPTLGDVVACHIVGDFRQAFHHC